ncbi:kielin/chordin-like protein [Antedon mediterranea]|uniref:kielin/chordin-like protein n=1 Tax=Antedon mediterranea TaxID=105859 RepID=UPI003AF6C3A4
MHRFLLFVVLLVPLDRATAALKCSPLDYEAEEDIPDCTFGCFCVGGYTYYHGTFTYKPSRVRTSSTICVEKSCDGASVTCADPTFNCHDCPDCGGRNDCAAEHPDGREVIIRGGSAEAVGCAVCTCNLPEPAEPCPGCGFKLFLGLLKESPQRRKATCDYSQCPCHGHPSEQVFETVADIPQCTLGCFCIRSESATLCIDPAVCKVDNKCFKPDHHVCGCPICDEGDCFAKSFEEKDVLISDNGPQQVGCAVCTCDAPSQPIVLPFFSATILDLLPPLPKRKATCDYSRCACNGFDEALIYDKIADIPECTFGCFCIRSEDQTLCIDPAPCLVSNICQHPEEGACGCPVCEDGDCFAKTYEGEEVLISDNGPQQLDCAVCTCEAASAPIDLPIFITGIAIPAVPPRKATCDYSRCVCQGFDEELVYETINDIPKCTFGCFCIRSEDQTLCIDPAPCLVSNICQHPEESACGCPVCEDGDCFAKTYEGEEVLISDRGSQQVDCAVCTCEAAIPPIVFPFFTPGTVIPDVSPRRATCDYSQCICQGVDDERIYDTIADIPECTFGCFCIRSEDKTLCIDGSPCAVSNKCQDPEPSFCGCPYCEDGNCVAHLENGEEVLISDDGPQHVGCAVCTCQEPDAPILLGLPPYNIPELPKREATCDFSQCACHGYDESQVYDTGADIPACTFGCFCIRSANAVLCVDPAPCEITNKCLQPTQVCGCPFCEGDGDCLAKSFENKEVVISADGPQDVGCAVCTCDRHSIPFIAFGGGGSVPPRTSTCDYSNCPCYGYEESRVLATSSDFPVCTFGCFCVKENGPYELCINFPPCELTNVCHNPVIECGCPSCQNQVSDCYAINYEDEEVLIPDDGPQDVGCAVCTCEPYVTQITYDDSRPELPKRKATCDYSNCVCHGFEEEQIVETYDDLPECANDCFCIRSENERVCIKQPDCFVNNECVEPFYFDFCRCPICEVGNCYARSFNSKEVLISDDGVQIVGGCAFCTCDPPSEPVSYPFYLPGIEKAEFPKRGSHCDYSACFPGPI